MRALRTLTKRSRREKNSDMLKKLPLNENANGMAEKPAEPTLTAPGGGVAAPSVAAVAGAGALVPPPTEILRKSTPEDLAALSSCTSRERVSSAAGTALPRRTTVA